MKLMKVHTLCFEKANNQHILTIHLPQRIFIYLFILKKFVLLQMIFFGRRLQVPTLDMG